MNLRERLTDPEPLLLDSAMGTELSRRGVAVTLPLWSAKALFDNCECVTQIHRENIRTGADIITTNTFRTTARTFSKAGLTPNEARVCTQKAVHLAQAAIMAESPERPIWIAGSIAPLEDCYNSGQPLDWETMLDEHRRQAVWLAESGVDFILLETMNSITEARAATLAAQETGLPVIVSFIIKAPGTILSGESLLVACESLRRLNIAGFGINCTNHRLITEFFNQHLEDLNLPAIAYANAGLLTDQGWIEDATFNPDIYSQVVLEWVKRGVKIVGGCCGTNPEHIRAIKEKVQCDWKSRWTGG